MNRFTLALVFLLVFPLGAVADDLPDSISLTILKASTVSDSIEFSMGQYYLPALSSGKYVEVDVAITNKGSDPFSVSYTNFFISSGGKRYAPSNLSIYFKNSLYFSTINPGMSKEASFLFEVPSSVQSIDLHYSNTGLQ